MAKKTGIKINDLVSKEVEFNGDKILTVQIKSEEKLYIAVKWVCDGIGLTKGQMQNERLKIQSDLVLKQGERILVLPTKGGVQEVQCIELNFLPLWLAKISITNNMQENNPEVVNKLIDYQLHAKDVLANYFLQTKKEKEEWNLTRQVGIVDRNRMTESIKVNIEESPNKKWCYSNYTNMVYEILFNKDAKQIKSERNCKNPRDVFTKEELKLVDEAETIVTALVSLGFDYNYIRKQLKNKFCNKLTVNS